MHVHLPTEAAQIVLAIVILVLVIYFAWYFPRSRSVLEHWAKQNGFEIIHSEFRWLFRGPFSFLSNRGQTVYRVRVRDHHGLERSGWVRCGSIWIGLFSDQAIVTWDLDDKVAA